MRNPRPRRPYRQLEEGTATVAVSGPYEPRVVENRVGRLVLMVLHRALTWRARLWSASTRERHLREQRIAAEKLGGSADG